MHSNLSKNTNYLRLCLQLASFWSTGKLQLVVQTHIRHPKFSQTTTPPVVVSTNCHEGTSIWSCLLCGPSLWLVSYYIRYCSTFSLTLFFTQRTLPNFLSSHWKMPGGTGEWGDVCENVSSGAGGRLHKRAADSSWSTAWVPAVIKVSPFFIRAW